MFEEYVAVDFKLLLAFYENNNNNTDDTVVVAIYVCGYV